MTEQLPSDPSDIEIVTRCNGLYVGMLASDELEAFERCVERGQAKRGYVNEVALFLGMPKVQVL